LYGVRNAWLADRTSRPRNSCPVQTPARGKSAATPPAFRAESPTRESIAPPLEGFPPLHPTLPRGPDATRRIVRYLNRTYRVLPTRAPPFASRFAKSL